MKKLLCAVLAFSVFWFLPARADHSVLARPGDIDETQAVDHAVEALTDELKTGESEIRGRWYCYAVYYEDWTWIDGFSGSVWAVELTDPDVKDTENSVQVHRCFSYILDASNGEVMQMEEKDAWDDISDPEDWQPLFVPTQQQIQPAEALARAQELLMTALDCDRDTLENWRDYTLTASTDPNGRFWYHVFMGYGGRLGSNTDPMAWHVYLDAHTGEIIWQTDPERFVGRWAVQAAGQDWKDWYQEQKTAYEAEWGGIGSWDYLQLAEFEKHCHGLPYWPEEHFGLPSENELSYENALSAARTWLEEQGMSSRLSLRQSVFYADMSNERHCLLAQGITESSRFWSFEFVSEDDPDFREEVFVDPVSGEIIDAGNG